MFSLMAEIIYASIIGGGGRTDLALKFKAVLFDKFSLVLLWLTILFTVFYYTSHSRSFTLLFMSMISSLFMITLKRIISFKTKGISPQHLQIKNLDNLEYFPGEIHAKVAHMLGSKSFDILMGFNIIDVETRVVIWSTEVHLASS